MFVIHPKNVIKNILKYYKKNKSIFFHCSFKNIKVLLISNFHKNTSKNRILTKK